MNATTQINLTFSNAVENGLMAMCVQYGSAVVEKLAEIYGFDVEDAKTHLGDLVKTVAKKVSTGTKKTGAKSSKKNHQLKEMNKIPLPFVGHIYEDACMGIKLVKGLHLQCANYPEDGHEYCKSCFTQSQKNSNNKPTYGDIRDRLECPLLDFVDAKGKRTVPFANVFKKLDISREEIEAKATEYGISIPEEHWEERSVKRGRPKSVTVSDTESDTSEKKRGRGRPKKDKASSGDVEDDLLSSLQEAMDSDAVSKSSGSSKGSRGRPKMSDEEKAERAAKKEAEKLAKKEAREAEKAKREAERLAKKEARELERIAKKEAREAEKAKKEAERLAKKIEEAQKAMEKANEKAKTDDEAKEEKYEEEEAPKKVNARKFTHEGVSYIKTADNMLYDIETKECVGLWNEDTEEIEAVEEESSDEEDDDECDDE